MVILASIHSVSICVTVSTQVSYKNWRGNWSYTPWILIAVSTLMCLLSTEVD